METNNPKQPNTAEIKNTFSPEQLKDIATKFAEWILNKDWEMTDLSGSEKMKTTAQLFDEFYDLTSH